MIVIFKAKKKFPDTGEILESSQWKEGGWIEKKSRGRLTMDMEPEPIERMVKKILENEIKSPFTVYIVNKKHNLFVK